MERDNILEGLFADPTLKAEKGFFLTDDNQAFAKGNETDGKNHAKTLEDDSLEWFERPAVKKGETEEGDLEEGEKEEVAKVIAPAKAKNTKVKDVSAEVAPTEDVPAIEVPTDDAPEQVEGSDILQ